MAQFTVQLISPLTNARTDYPIFSPGQPLIGQLSSFQDLKSISKVHIELSGWQYSTASQSSSKQHMDERGIAVGKGSSNVTGTFASLALQEGGIAASPKSMAQFTRKRLFSHVTEITTGLNEGMTFRMDVPYAGEPEKNGKSVMLPPSLHLGKKPDSTVVAYNRYQVKVTVKRKGMFKKNQTIAVPFILLPLTGSSALPLPSIQSILSSSNPSYPPNFPEKWQVSETRRVILASGDSLFTQTAKDVGAKIGGLFRRGSEKEEVREEVGAVHVQLGLPHLETWPLGVPVPYYLTLTTDRSFQPPTYSQSSNGNGNGHHNSPMFPPPNALDPSRLSTNFLLGQMYMTKAGAHENMQPRLIRGVAPGEKAPNSGQMEKEQVSGGKVEVTREGIWVDGDRLVVVGTLRLVVLPGTSTGLIVAYPYKLHVEVELNDSNSTIASSKKGLAEDLTRPRISASGIEHLGSQDIKDLVHNAYWNEISDLELSDNALYQG